MHTIKIVLTKTCSFLLVMATVTYSLLLAMANELYIRVIFIRDPCKKCLLQACCTEYCDKKRKHSYVNSSNARCLQFASFMFFLCAFLVILSGVQLWL